MNDTPEKPTFKQQLRTEILDKLSVKRLLIYCLGLFLIAMGISISAKSSLGVSPVNSIPYTVCLLTGIEQGFCTTVFFILLIFMQYLISPKTFSPFAFLQIICSFVFGWFVILSNLCLSFIPAPEDYLLKMIFIISVCSITVRRTVIASKPENQAFSWLKITFRVILSRTHYLMSSSFRP